MEDFYAILEVSPDASGAKVKESYRRLALRLHPDKNPSPTATTLFQQLGRAWETLKDPQKRRTYDTKREVEVLKKGREARAAEKKRKDAILAEQQKRDSERKRREAELATERRKKAEIRELERKVKEAEIERKEADKKVREAEMKMRVTVVTNKWKEFEVRHREAANKLKEEKFAQKTPQGAAAKARVKKSFTPSTYILEKGAIATGFGQSQRGQKRKAGDGEDHDAKLELKIQKWKHTTAFEHNLRLQDYKNNRSRIYSKIMEIKSSIFKAEDWNRQFHAFYTESKNYYQSLLRSEGRTISDDTLNQLAEKNAKDLLSRHEGFRTLTMIGDWKKELERYRKMDEAEKADFEQRNYRFRKRIVKEALDFMQPEPLAEQTDTAQDAKRELHRQIWQRLGKIQPAVSHTTLIEGGGKTEGPWHDTWPLNNVDEGVLCGRCGGPAKGDNEKRSWQCHYCSMIVCPSCHGDLRILREFEAWLEGKKPDSLFGIDVSKRH